MIHTADIAVDANRIAPAFVADREWWGRVFAAVDAADADAFVEFLTPDAQFRFANAPRVVGRAAINAAVDGFFAAIGSSRHTLLATWSGTGTAGCEGEVLYTRHDGSAVSFPFANAFDLRGGKISSYRIYIDISSLFPAT